jgi:putative addiction module antidote
MTKPVKLVAIGNSTGIVLPKDVLARLRLGQGDLLSVSETPGGIELRPHEPDFEEQMDAARAVMRKRRAALRELAK